VTGKCQYHEQQQVQRQNQPQRTYHLADHQDHQRGRQHWRQPRADTAERTCGLIEGDDERHQIE